jgi:hypothetical protein
MKILKGKTCVQDLNLKVGEVFQVGTGISAFKMRYEGQECRGSQWDKLTPIVARTPQSEPKPKEKV